MSRLKRFSRHAERGQDIVEYALTLPLLMLLLVGIVEFGLAVWRYDALANAAREVARCGIIYNNLVTPNSIEDCIDNSIDHFGTGLGLTRDNFDVAFTEDNIRVQVDYDYQPITGMVMNSTLAFRTVATMENEY